jgi:WD40 repeat protein
MFCSGSRVGIYEDYKVRLFDAASGKQVGKDIGDAQLWVGQTTSSPDGEVFATVVSRSNMDQAIRFWRTLDGRMVSELLPEWTKGGLSLKNGGFTPDNRRFVTPFWPDGTTIKVWDVKAGKLETTLFGDPGMPIIFTHPNNQWVIASGGGRTLVYTLDPNELTKRLKDVVAQYDGAADTK